MDRVLESAEISMQTVSAVGIAVYRHGGHIGVLFRSAGRNGAKILHLGGHLDLRCEAPSEKYNCWIRPAIHLDRAKSDRFLLSSNLEERTMMGGFRTACPSPGQFFDFSGHQIRARGPAKVGLTCASFVLGIFHAAGFPLVKYDSWPLPLEKDIETQRSHLRVIKERHPDETEHAASIETEIGNIRYTPLRMAGRRNRRKVPSRLRVCCCDGDGY